ncbi:molybdenum cofactor guanylyltransferase [Candidatus Omnitrophota bacterium]
MHKINKDFSGVVLAGGKSSRMGTPKQFLTVDGKRLIDITLEALQPLFSEILIVTNNKNNFVGFKNVKIVEDIIKDCGPLGGIHAGLKAISNDKGFFVACDMPDLHKNLVRRLLEAAEDSFDCIVPSTEKGIEPLHAVYSKSLLPELEISLRKKEYSIKQFLKRCNCNYVKIKPEEESSFYNINTSEDLEILHG